MMRSFYTQSVFCVLIISVVAIFGVRNSDAETISATSCSENDVQSAINSASTGDTVIVPSGSCSWSSLVNISKKSIVLVGAGIDRTKITGKAYTAVRLSGNQSSRITGFTFYISGTTGVEVVGGSNWRIDHCKFEGLGTSIKNAVFGYGQPGERFIGLVDNCEFINGKVLHYGEPSVTGKMGHTEWTRPLDMGTNQAVYIEDCDFNLTLSQYNCVDTNNGGRYVFRFNNLTNFYIMAHSFQTPPRGSRLWEVYHNRITTSGSFKGYAPIRPRGGTGVIFNNYVSGSWTDKRIFLDNVRSSTAKGSYGQCDGTEFADGNQDGTGWPCRDQIGRSMDEREWDFSDPAPRQASAPAYIWLNRKADEANAMLVAGIASTGSNQQHIKRNRDFFEEVTAEFDGASGVGIGTLADRPATCAPGVAYWATDQGDWNRSGSGEQGVLYKCTSLNKWELYYVPYEYPHPLRRGLLKSSVETPGNVAAPSGVTIRQK